MNHIQTTQMSFLFLTNFIYFIPFYPSQLSDQMKKESDNICAISQAVKKSMEKPVTSKRIFVGIRENGRFFANGCFVEKDLLDPMNCKDTSEPTLEKNDLHA